MLLSVGFGGVLGGVVLVVALIRISAEIPMYKGMGGGILDQGHG